MNGRKLIISSCMSISGGERRLCRFQQKGPWQSESIQVFSAVEDPVTVWTIHIDTLKRRVDLSPSTIWLV